MNNKTIITLTVLITAAILVGGYFAWQYELDRNQSKFEEGYSDGLLYTQNSGNIVYKENETIKEEPLGEVCRNILQQQLNQQGGQ